MRQHTVVIALMVTASLAAASGAQEKTPSPDSRLATIEKAGFALESADGKYKLRLSGYAQLDARFYASDREASATDAFVLRRARPIVQGIVDGWIDFYINPDFGGGQTTLQDAYVDVRLAPAARVRVGKFKAPVGLERLQSGSTLLFVERGLPTAVAPNRDLGAEIHGELATGIVTYAVAVTNGSSDGGSVDSDNNDGKDVAGRLFVRPFHRTNGSLHELGLGLAGTAGRAAGAPAAYRTSGQLPLFSYGSGVVADGRRTRLAPQASLYAGPWGVFGEWVRSEQVLASGALRTTVKATAWQAAASWVLTGEAASAAGVRPRHPAAPGLGGWGALELVARVNGFDADRGAFAAGFADPTRSAHRARAWAAGVNWYLSRHLRLVADYERTTFTGGAKEGDRKAENAVFLRTQVAY